jgi:FKBP-type peptidyl-prolyl cis-trans isomerase
MKAHFMALFVSGLLVSSVSAQDKPDLTDANQKYNYAFGLDIISTFKQQDIDIDLKAFMAGMKDALAGKPALTTEEQKAALKELTDDFTAKADKQWKAAAVKNLKDGQAFLAANAKKEGIKIKKVIAPDGSEAELQYKIVRSGPAGPSPKTSDIVEVHYIGTWIDGTVFDSSVKRGVPATFGMSQVVPGWTEALQMMRVGDKWQLFIPAALAYGEAAPAQIGPNNALIFEVELLSFYTPKPDNSAPGTNAPPSRPKERRK